MTPILLSMGKGLLSTLYSIFKFPIKIPLGIIIAAIVIGIYMKDTAVAVAIRKTIVEITAKAEIQALEAIIINNEKLLAEQEKQLEEQRILMEIESKIVRELEEQIEKDEQELKEALEKLDELSNQPPPDACVVDESILNRMRNQ